MTETLSFEPSMSLTTVARLLVAAMVVPENWEVAEIENSGS
ncbi:MAG: hypothetical protein ACM3PY_07180 [Omnitrophica WOR_2 bacterium]